MFALDDVTIRYAGVPALHNVSLRIGAGERVALLGASGAGKSTLLTTLRGQHPAGVALIPQNVGLVASLSVFHNVYIGRLHRHSTAYNLRNLVWPARRELDAVAAVIAPLGLDGLLRKPVGELSGGQAQRTAVARALFQGGDVLMGDEPVSAVDPRGARVVLDALHDAFDTVVLAMHDVTLALDYATRIIGIREGRVALDAPASDLTRDDLSALYRTRTATAA